MTEEDIDQMIEDAIRAGERYDEWYDEQPRCEEYSWLKVSDCAHCKGVRLDPDLEPAARAAVMGQ